MVAGMGSSLLVGKQTSAATLEDNWTSSYQAQQSYQTSQHLSVGTYSNELKTGLLSTLYMNIYSDLIPMDQNSKAPKTFFK